MRDRNAIGAAGLLVMMMVIGGAPAFGDGSKYPDWESQWRNPNAGKKGNPWDPNKPMGLGQQAPLTPEYQALFETSLKDQKSGGQGNSRGSACALPGMPKTMSLSEPMEILITPPITYFVPQHYPVRRIYTDGRDWPTDEPPTFTGYSIGRWIDEDGDGRYDALEIETRNFTGPRVFESSGLPLHRDNQTLVKERLALDKDNNDILHDVITTIDHALTQPWTVDKAYIRDRDPKWVEFNCHESNNHVVIGTEEYFVGADGKLMPVRAGQPPPDLQYFK